MAQSEKLLRGAKVTSLRAIVTETTLARLFRWRTGRLLARSFVTVGFTGALVPAAAAIVWVVAGVDTFAGAGRPAGASRAGLVL